MFLWQPLTCAVIFVSHVSRIFLLCATCMLTSLTRGTKNLNAVFPVRGELVPLTSERWKCPTAFFRLGNKILLMLKYVNFKINATCEHDTFPSSNYNVSLV